MSEHRPSDQERPGVGALTDGSGTERAAERLQADAADLLEANRTLREAVRRSHAVLAAAARELRGPVSSILRQVARLQHAPPAGDGRALRALERQSRRLDALSRALLAIDDLAGGPPPQRRPSELGPIVTRAAEARRPAAEARGVELACELPPYPLVSRVDGGRMEELAGALLDAALAATADHGRVRLALQAGPGVARLTVEDGGVARAAERPRSPPAPTPPATVIALEVCRALAEQNGGALEISARGAGRTAVATLPLAGAAEQELPPPRKAGEGRARVLVVDDDPDAREALTMVLGEDYDVLVAGDGLEATETAQSARPDLLLMDLYMPRMDGLAALETLRADELTAAVPVILISARGDDLTRSRALDLGAVDFLQKPFSARELRARIERTLRLTRRETQLQVLAWTDPLTGLANVRAFRGRLAEELKRARRYRTSLACVMVDMDNLKPINDQLGHAAGDVAIATVAEVIRHELRETDFGARYGGDEFVLLLPHTSSGEARVLAERVAARLRAADVQAGGRRLPLSASFGISALAEDDEGGEMLVRRADAALYRAKHTARGSVATDPGAEPALRAP